MFDSKFSILSTESMRIGMRKSMSIKFIFFMVKCY